MDRYNRNGIIVYIECQSFCSVVGIWSPHSLPPQASVSPPHLGPIGGATLTCRGGVVGPNSNEGIGILLLYEYYTATVLFKFCNRKKKQSLF